jgi:formylglycine-generating enzyme
MSTDAPSADARSQPNMIELAGGSFLMGTDDETGFPADGEGPVREVELSPFLIGKYSVTNREFARFITATQYETEAETFGWTFVFHLLLPDDFPPTRAVSGAAWWRQVEGGTWSHPFGPQSGLKDLLDHPVTHVSWNDAQAYCNWIGGRLPTEAEWEYAARGGLEQKRYAWGDEFAPDGTTMCNIFEGKFPIQNSAKGGYVGTAPVDAFAANGFGLYNVAGNVWEWCSDWFSDDFHKTTSTDNPQGPPDGESRVMRGGSYLCHDSYCNRYRVAARSRNTPDSSTGNLGFRVAASLQEKR